MIRTVTLNPAVDKTVEVDNFRLGAVNRISAVRLDAGVNLAVISLGADGALFAEGDKVIHAPGLAVKVKSTVGAGDAMVAALALALERGYPLEKSVTLSMAAGAANVATSGTQPPRLEDILEYERQVCLNYL